MKLKVLVVDDDQDIRELVQLALEVRYSNSDGLEVITCSNMSAAIDQIVGSVATFDLVISDYRIPVHKREFEIFTHREGITIARCARRHSIPVIVMSGDMTDRDRQDCPADAFVKKPFQLECLYETIDQVLAAKAGVRV